MYEEEKRVLKTVTYYYGADFADFPRFFNCIDEDGDFGGVREKNELEYQIYRNELQRLLKLREATNIEKKLLLDFKKTGYLLNYEKIKKSMSKIFSIKQWPKLHIIDEELSVSGNEHWEAMTIDYEDEKFFGIESGIYYQKKYLTHAYFEFIIAHELIHWIISQYSKEYFPYVSIYEEGLCDLFSAFFLDLSNVIPTTAIINLYLYNRHFKLQGSLWNNYNIYMNEMIIYGLKYGEDFLINLIKGGRAKVQNIRNEGSKENCFSIDSRRFRKIMFGLLNINNYFSVDIEEYVVMKYLDEKKTDFLEYKQLKKEVDLSNIQIKNALYKLNEKGYIFLKENNIFIPNKNISIKMRYKNE